MSDPMRASVLSAFLLSALASPALAQGIVTGWEDGQRLGASDRVLYARNVAPGAITSRRQNEERHGGAYSLLAYGRSNGGGAYCYTLAFDDDVPIRAGARLRYWIWHAGTFKVSVDGHFTDGSTIRDGGFVDQAGVRLHPAMRQEPLGRWIQVDVDLSAAAGKVLDKVIVGFDNGGDGYAGEWRAYIDDLIVGPPGVARPAPRPGMPPAPPAPGPAAQAVDVQLRAWNGQWVVAEGGGGGAVNANRSGAGVWETFGLLDLNGGSLSHGDPVALRAHDGAHFLGTPGGGALDARATSAGAAQAFVVERLAGAGPLRDGDQVGLRASDGRYLVAEGGGGGVVNANRSGVGPWETFRLHAAPGARLAAHPSPLMGRIRIENGVFRDDTGPVLPIFCHFGEAFSRYTRNPDAVRRQLDQIAQAGYHGIRFWMALTNPFWSGREVSEAFTPDYWGKLRSFLRDLEARQLRAVISQGDISPRDIPDRVGHMRQLSDVLDQVGPDNTVAWIEGGNETWQNGENDPRKLAQFMQLVENRHPNVLKTLSSPPGETPAELDAWSIDPADMFDVHGSRSGHYWDKIRHIFSIAYEGNLRRRLGWQGEPTGPGAAVSVTENKQELDDDTLAGMAAMSLMARQAWCYMSGPGVLFDSPIDAQPGFFSVPKVRDALPRDVMGFQRLIHGGQRWANERIFEVIGDTRCDHALSDDGRFVVVIYGPQLTYNQVRPATIDKVTDLGGKVRIVVGRR